MPLWELLRHGIAFVPCTEYARLRRVCRASAEYVARREKEAALRLSKWWWSHRLAPIDDDAWTRNWCTKRALIRNYMARYPDDYVPQCTAAFCRMLQRPDLSPPTDTTGRRALLHVLERCAKVEIMYVGW